MGVDFDTHTLCGGCKGGGIKKRGGKAYVCNRCKGTGVLVRADSICMCGCMCSNVATIYNIVCDACDAYECPNYKAEW